MMEMPRVDQNRQPSRISGLVASPCPTGSRANHAVPVRCFTAPGRRQKLAHADPLTFWILSAALHKVQSVAQRGWIDNYIPVADILHMLMTYRSTAWLKALMCLCFVFALVFSPPSASHAASGMHGNHHVIAASQVHSDDAHSHGTTASASLHETCGFVSTADDGDQSSTQCCSGICLSIALIETDSGSSGNVKRGRYDTLQAQATSIKPAGFLRPPQFLI